MVSTPRLGFPWAATWRQRPPSLSGGVSVLLTPLPSLPLSLACLPPSRTPPPAWSPQARMAGSSSAPPRPLSCPPPGPRSLPPPPRTSSRAGARSTSVGRVSWRPPGSKGSRPGGWRRFPRSIPRPAGAPPARRLRPGSCRGSARSWALRWARGREGGAQRGAAGRDGEPAGLLPGDAVAVWVTPVVVMAEAPQQQPVLRGGGGVHQEAAAEAAAAAEIPRVDVRPAMLE